DIQSTSATAGPVLLPREQQFCRVGRAPLSPQLGEEPFFLAVRNGSDAAARKPSPGAPAGRGCTCRSTVRCRRGRARRVAPCWRRRIACPWWGRCGAGSVRPCVRRAGLRTAAGGGLAVLGREHALDPRVHVQPLLRRQADGTVE